MAHRAIALCRPIDPWVKSPYCLALGIVRADNLDVREDRVGGGREGRAPPSKGCCSLRLTYACQHLIRCVHLY